MNTYFLSKAERSSNRVMRNTRLGQSMYQTSDHQYLGRSFGLPVSSSAWLENVTLYIERSRQFKKKKKSPKVIEWKSWSLEQS